MSCFVSEKMDCCICSPMLSIYRPPRNTICVSCYEGAKNMVSFLNKLQNDENIDRQGDPPLEPSSPKGISHAWEWMNEMMKKEEEMNEKMVFLESLLGALREGLHTDILLKPGRGGTPIPAHRALLATRSGILRTILESDECKTATEDSISFPEFSHEELLSLLEFLYSGKLNREKAKTHAYSLLVAADKYDIHYLKKFCEIQILGFLDSSNALRVLEVSDVCSNKKLKESALNSIIKHMNDVVFSEKFDEFAMKNAHLCVDITRALLMEVRETKGLPSSRTLENG